MPVILIPGSAPEDYAADEKVAAEGLLLLSQNIVRQIRLTDFSHVPTVKNNCQLIASVLATSASTPRLFQCAICDECFPTGQALGGHKRKHYDGVIVRSNAGGENGITFVSTSLTAK